MILFLTPRVPFFFRLMGIPGTKKKSPAFFSKWLGMVLSKHFFQKKKMWKSSTEVPTLLTKNRVDVFSGYQVYRTGGEISPPPFF